MRVVIDTNVFVSAVLGRTPHAIFDFWQVDRFIMIVSDEIVQEYLGVLRRPKFQLTTDIIDPIMARIFQRAEFVSPDEHINVIVADPTDNKFIEAALTGHADYIVSGDSHILDLHTFTGIPVITAAKFLEILGNS